MLRALSEAVGEHVSKSHELSARHEGISEDGWLLLDYGDIVVHLFSPEKRDYYRLEDLWSEGKVLVHLQ